MSELRGETERLSEQKRNRVDREAADRETHALRLQLLELERLKRTDGLLLLFFLHAHV